MVIQYDFGESKLHRAVRAVLLGLLAGALNAAATAAAGTTGRFVSALDTNEQLFSRFIVSYRDPTAAAQSGRIASDLAQISSTTGFDLHAIRHLLTGGWLIESASSMDLSGARRVLEQFSLLDVVENAQPDYIYRASTVDPDLSYQWHLPGVIPNTLYPDARGWDFQAGANISAGWNYSKGDGVRIAVIDTGYTNHADLIPRFDAGDTPGQTYWGFDFVYGTQDQNDPAIGEPADWDCNAADPGDYYPGHPSSWHGTHVMGLAAAAYNNGLYGAGVAPNAVVIPVRALGAGGGYDSEVADALVWASGSTKYLAPSPIDPTPPTTWRCGGNQYIFGSGLRNVRRASARVINMSLGRFGACTTTSNMQQAINVARTNGSVVVVAAGNDNTQISEVSPAGCSGVIAVGATDFGGHRGSVNGTPYSNWGPYVAPPNYPSLTLAAPGGGMYYNAAKHQFVLVPMMSDLNTGTTTPMADTFGGETGTSMAAPLVAGLVAAMVAIKPWLSADQVQTQLAANAHPWGSGGVPAPDVPFGAGLMDAAATLAAVSALTNPPPPSITATPNPVVVPAGQSGGNYSLSWSVPGYTVVDVWTQDPLTSGSEFWFDGTQSATTTQAHYVAIVDPIAWRLTPHGQPNVVLAQVTVTAHH